jgi:hypothetical protein
MPTLDEARFRDCPWCGTRTVAMIQHWSQVIPTSSGTTRCWAVLACPRCGGLVSLELRLLQGDLPQGNSPAPSLQIEELTSVPEDEQRRYRVEHLPPDVERYFSTGQRVIEAGVPDAAAVQLRRTLEAAAAHKGIKENRLVDSIKKLVDQGYITKDFSGVLDHVRKIGNLGAHHTDERVDDDSARQALRFTTALLRDLFEVPAELQAIQAQGAAQPD